MCKLQDIEKKKKKMDLKKCKKFVADHIDDCENILIGLEEINLILLEKN